MAMQKIQTDIDTLLSLEDKKRLLKEIGHEDLLDLFKQNYQPRYSPIASRKAPLDQQVSLTISKKEKDILAQDLFQIRKAGPGISISSYVRHQAISDIDLEEWSQRALKALKELSHPDYDMGFAEKQRRLYAKLLEDPEDEEQEFYYQKEYNRYKNILDFLKKKSFKRRFRLSGRITFQEARHIRWRAARLSLTVADFLRYLIFGYMPGGEADRNLSLAARQRFYVSILDVYRNGWGDPPEEKECTNCMRYLDEIKRLKGQIDRLRFINR